MTASRAQADETATTEAPTTLREWNETATQKLSKGELLTILEEERKLRPNSGLMTAHDHIEKAWELVDDGDLVFNQENWWFVVPSEEAADG